MKLSEISKINGETKLLGLVGRGISYSLSPLIQNVAIDYFRLNMAYLPFDLPEATLENFLRCFWQMGGIGLNVTTPYKERVAQIIKCPNLVAVNTLYRGGGEFWSGASTDGLGFAEGLIHIDCNLSDFDQIVILGLGGAAVSLVEFFFTKYFSPANVPQIYILARNQTKIAAVKERFPGVRFFDFNVESLRKTLVSSSGKTLIIQATNAPKKGEDLKEFIPALEGFGGVVVDLIYDQPSALLRAAKAMGIRAQDGLPMLIEQARAAQKIWWGKSAPYGEISGAIKTAAE